MVDIQALFERRIAYPDPSARDRLDRLVGLDDHKDRLTKILALLVHPRGLTTWSQKYHPGANLLVDTVLNRPPLVILAGDVGSGKTELAETIGDAVARQEEIDVVLLPLSLATRGQGRVGEMTQLISAAFDFAVKEASSMVSGKVMEGAVILLVDEADALAQSRQSPEMHHENVSGVNAFIRGIDRLSSRRLPAAVIMCTNRYEALDPAVKRRAAEILSFGRPDEERRRSLLQPKLAELGFEPQHIDAIVSATGPINGRPGFTYSDLTQRLIPAIVLDAYPSAAIEPPRAVAIAERMEPTAPFGTANEHGADRA
ncbi:MAG: AAA family ATPase [Sphingomicrobium sp.]